MNPGCHPGYAVPSGRVRGAGATKPPRVLSSWHLAWLGQRMTKQVTSLHHPMEAGANGLWNPRPSFLNTAACSRSRSPVCCI